VVGISEVGDIRAGKGLRKEVRVMRMELKLAKGKA
jgi:hypothetical protein